MPQMILMRVLLLIMLLKSTISYLPRNIIMISTRSFRLFSTVNEPPLNPSSADTGREVCDGSINPTLHPLTKFMNIYNNNIYIENLKSINKKDNRVGSWLDKGNRMDEGNGELVWLARFPLLYTWGGGWEGGGGGGEELLLFL